MSGAAVSPASAARRVLRLAATGSLATLVPEGGPFASLVTVATMPAGEPILLISALARHTRTSPPTGAPHCYWLRRAARGATRWPARG